MKKKQIKFFDNWAKEYLLNKVPQYGELLEAIYKALAEKLDKKDIKRISDLGTGTGILCMMSKQFFPNLEEITAVDISKEMLKVLSNNWEQNNYDPKILRLVESDLENLSLDPNHYDLVTASFSLHHIPHDRKTETLRKVNDILKKGGILAIGETMFESQAAPHKIAPIYLRKSINGLINVSISQFFREIDFFFKILRKEGEYMTSMESWVKHLQDAGFAILEKKFTHPKLTYGYIIAEKE